MAERTSTSEQPVAELAEVILEAARQVQSLDLGPDVIALTGLEGLVMQQIDREPGVSPKELGERLRLKSSNTSAVLRSLVAKGLVTRAKDASDRRGVHLHPTPLAAQNLERLRRTWGEQLARALGEHAQAAEMIVPVLRELARELERGGGD